MHKVSLTLLIGTTLVCIGLSANPWSLAQFSFDGILEFETRVQIWFFDAVLILLGVALILWSRRTPSGVGLRYWNTYPKTVALSLGIGLASVLLLLTEGLFHFLNRAQPKDPRVYEHLEEGQSGNSIDVDFHQRDALLGYKPAPNRRLVSKMMLSGRQIYSVTYSTNAHGWRVSPVSAGRKADRFVLFFGCSFTFGQGLQDDQTLPFYAGQLASGYRPYNFGVMGYGPQQMLALLQDGSIKREVGEKEGILIYVFIDDHMNRLIGSRYVVQTLGKHMPYFYLDSNGNLQRKGSFASGRPGLTLLFWFLQRSAIATYFQIGMVDPIGTDEFDLMAKVLVESRAAFSRLFSTDRFYVLIYPGSRRGKRLMPYFEKSQIRFMDYSNLFDPTDEDLHIEGDPHPTAKAHRLVAKQLTRDIGIQDVGTAAEFSE
jgi:hypothetical protein